MRMRVVFTLPFSRQRYGSGSGYLFFQGHKYGLSVSSTKIRRVWVTTIDLIGTASNLRNAADIIGTYTGADDQVATIRRSKVVRLQNAKGIVRRDKGSKLEPFVQSKFVWNDHKKSRLGTIFGIVAAFADWLLQGFSNHLRWPSANSACQSSLVKA